MPTVKFNIREEVMMEALKIKEKMGLTWREVALQGLGIRMEPPQIGRPRREPEIKTVDEKNLEKQIMGIVYEAFYRVAIWRDFLPVIELPEGGGWKYYRYYTEICGDGDYLTLDGEQEKIPHYEYKEAIIPIISKYFKVFKNERLNVEGIRDASIKMAMEEGMLILTGEHAKWTALGIKGFSTIEGRNIVSSGGPWPENALIDIIQVRRDFKPQNPVILIVPTHILNSLNHIMWRDPDHLKPPTTYKNFLIQQEIVSKIYETDTLFTEKGTQDCALILTPSKDNAFIVQSLEIGLTTWKDKTGETQGILREAITPIITRPQTITQITNITTPHITQTTETDR